MRIVSWPHDWPRIRLVSRYLRMLITGGDRVQGPGKYFVPGRLEGYFNDLTSKTQWRGPLNPDGLPLNRVNGCWIVFPTTVIQKGLGHWDRWLGSGQRSENEKRLFLLSADWATQSLDSFGGWPVWPLLGITNVPTLYSAMTQGEGISLLVRAFCATGEKIYLDAAVAALKPFEKNVQEGGVVSRVSEGVVLEESPFAEYRAILNGWIFAAMGLHDLLLVGEKIWIRNLLRDTITTLVNMLPLYDAGYWSFYDLSRHLASPFYHRLHIAQLEVLALAFPEQRDALLAFKKRFERQEKRGLCKARATIMKLVQKFVSPPEVILE